MGGTALGCGNIFISFDGPATAVIDQITADHRNYLNCIGFEGDALTGKVDRELQVKWISAALGKDMPTGELRFMSGISDSDPQEALQQVIVPGLLVFEGSDRRAPADLNPAYFQEIFAENSSINSETVVIPDAQLIFRLVDTPCRMYGNYSSGPISEELVLELQGRLAE